MDKEEILFWNEKYDREEDQLYPHYEAELIERFKREQKATKSDLEKAFLWKFQGGLAGRGKHIFKYVEKQDDFVIERLTELAFYVQDDRLRLKLLTTINGVGPSMASVILTFFDPENYGVLDFHVWRGLFGEYKTVFSNSDCLKFFEKLRSEAQRIGLFLQGSGKGHFQKGCRYS